MQGYIMHKCACIPICKFFILGILESSHDYGNCVYTKMIRVCLCKDASVFGICICSFAQVCAAVCMESFQTYAGKLPWVDARMYLCACMHVCRPSLSGILESCLDFENCVYIKMIRVCCRDASE